MTLRKTLTIIILLITTAWVPQVLMATHQRAAEITYRHLSGLTYEITLISYTYTLSPANAYRDNLTIDWGDGTVSEIPRVEIQELAGDISYNRYKGQHTFAGPATYVISCEDPNRNGGILNIPNSINVPLFIFSELVINPFIGGYNNSPVLLIPPIDNACVDQPFYHNPGAYDVDGDSLSYRLVTCYGAMGLPIPGYTLPPATNFLSLDPRSGDFIWDSPPNQGEYNIAILIEEWREGVKIGSVLRDMQIIVVACNNRPPVIDPIADTCVEAGHQLTFTVSASDPDSNIITLTGTGGPLILSANKAFLDPDPAIDTGHVSTTFTWNTVCEHVKKSPYQVFFKAKDNGTPVNLVSIRSMKIRVVGPAPENLTAVPLGDAITLTWEAYACPNASGYLIYRKADSTGFVHGYCETGVPPYLGYQKIAEINGIGVTSYVDDNGGAGLFQGVRYCYMVVAYYPDKAEGYASNEACTQLRRDLPVLTNVSINTTAETTGSVYAAWSKPTEIDTIQAPGPYKYVLLRSRSDVPETYIAVDSSEDLNDTIFTDTLLNTKDYGFRYRVRFFNNTPGMHFLIGTSQPASSMYLTIQATDEMLNLSWTNNVPWTNDTFTIMRKDALSVEFDSIGYSLSNAFADKGLQNGVEYCYAIRSRGHYSAGGFVDPILNLSQTSCGIPIDNIPPCPPVLSITTICDERMNILTWHYTGDTCSHDIAKVLIFFSPKQGEDPVLTDSVVNPSDTSFSHIPGSSVAGCYFLVSVDSAGNRSEPGNLVCVDYSACPLYRLPYAFTPNGDGTNDFFIPFPYSSVEKIELVMLDRWGRQVFHTSDPDIRWDGKDETTHSPCSDGVYFYVCDVYEITLEGTVVRTLRGSVTIFR